MGKYIRVTRGGALFLLWLAGEHVKRSHAVIFDRVSFGRRVAFAFFRQDVNESGSVDLLDVFQGRHHLGNIMPVDGTDVLEP